ISGTPMTYQWLFAGSELPGETSSSLTLSNLQAAKAGGYSVRISNAAGVITSAVASVTVIPASPSIVTNLSSRAVVAGSDVTFQIATSGSEPFSFQWWFNGAQLPNETNAS